MGVEQVAILLQFAMVVPFAHTDGGSVRLVLLQSSQCCGCPYRELVSY